MLLRRSSIAARVIVREERRQDSPQPVPRAPRAVVTGCHGRPFHVDGMCDVLLHAVSDETSFLRGQRFREEQRLAQSQGFLSHRVAGALEVRPDIGGEEPDEQAEDHGERRQRHRRGRLERGLVTAPGREAHRPVDRGTHQIGPGEAEETDDESRLGGDPDEHGGYDNTSGTRTSGMVASAGAGRACRARRVGPFTKRRGSVASDDGPVTLATKSYGHAR